MKSSAKLLDLVVRKGRLEPAGPADIQTLRGMDLAVGEIMTVRVVQARSAGFMRLAHRLARLVRENITGFEHLTDHDALKRLQWESGVECDTMAVHMPQVGMVEVRMPRSIRYDAMDEDAFRDMMRSLCDYIVMQYWPDCSAAQIEAMAESMIE